MAKTINSKAKKYHKDKIFFNYATVGPVNAASYRAASEFLKDYLQIGPPEVLDKYDVYADKLAQEAAKLLNCSPKEISYIKNTTEGIFIASETLPLKSGDEVLLMANEYPANLLPWLKKRRDGIIVKLIDAKDNRHAFYKLLENITTKTRVVSISWGQYYDGFFADLELLSKVCKENNAFLVVDGVHGVGSRKIDLQKVNIDILSCGGQKEIGAVVGIGFIYVNKNTLGKLLDFKIGIRSVTNFDKSGYELKKDATRFYDGTQNILGIVSLYAALKDINDTGIGVIEKKNINLLNEYKTILRDNNIVFIDYKNQADILSLKVPKPEALTAFLREKNIYVKTVKNALRISFSHHCNVEDFLVLVKHIRTWTNLLSEKQFNKNFDAEIKLKKEA